MRHNIKATLGPSGCDARNSIEMDGKKLLVREFNVRAAVGEYTQVTVVMDAPAIELSLENVELRGVKSAPSYCEWASHA